jgi:membrane protein
MAAAPPGVPRTETARSPQNARQVQHQQNPLTRNLNTLGNFWIKINNDWIFNFSGTIAYVLEASIIPILLAIIGVGGLILGAISPETRTTLENAIADSLPGGASGPGGDLVSAAVNNLNQSAGVFLIVGIVTAIFTGSGLFITLENVFGVIFRLRGRDLLHQRLMAIGMMLLYIVLVPIILLASIVPPAILRALGLGRTHPVGSVVWPVVGLFIAWLVAVLFFGAVYLVVPNRKMRVGEVWAGALISAALLVIYQAIFPLYVGYFIHPRSYGSVVGFALVILVFFYYLAFILLLGAEINSWRAGQRQTASPINAILHELQAHNTTRGAAGPTAGNPGEDLQSGRGAAAMRDTVAAIYHERTQHQGDALPPQYAESGSTGTGYRIVAPGVARSLTKIAEARQHRRRVPYPTRVAHTREQAIVEARLLAMASSPAPRPTVEDSTRHRERAALAPAQPLSKRQRHALLALAGASVVAVVGAARFLYSLVLGGSGGNTRHPATS